MEQLQGVDVILDLYHRAVELQGVVDQVLKGVQVYVFAKEGTGHIVGNILEAHLRHVVDECLRQAVNLFGHIEPAVFGQSFYDGLLKVGHGGLTVCAVIVHIAI